MLGATESSLIKTPTAKNFNPRPYVRSDMMARTEKSHQYNFNPRPYVRSDG